MEDIKDYENRQFNTNVNLYWQQAMLNINENKYHLVFPTKNVNEFHFSELSKTENESFKLFAEEIELTNEVHKFSQTLKKQGHPITPEAAFAITRDSVFRLYCELEKWGFVVSVPNKNHMTGGTFITFHITATGIEVVLKLQEHKDNERRHHNTVNYSKKAFYVSMAALFAAMTSVYFSYERLNLYEKQIEKMQVSQDAILDKIEINKL